MYKQYNSQLNNTTQTKSDHLAGPSIELILNLYLICVLYTNQLQIDAAQRYELIKYMIHKKTKKLSQKEKM